MSFLSAIVVIALFVMVPVLVSLRKTGVPGITNFCIACSLCAAAAAIGLLTELTSPWFHAGLRGMLVFAASLASWNGFQEFLGEKPMETPVLASLLVATAGVLALFLFTFESGWPAIVIASLMAAIVYTLTGAVIAQNWRHEVAIAPYMIVCSAAAFAMAALRIAAGLSDMVFIAGLAEDPLIGTTYVVARQLTAPIFFLSIILLLHGWIIASLRHLIAHDELTGALSRRAFLEEYETLRASTPETEDIALMLLDLDRFKQINDRHGHAGGDAALVHFADTVKTVLQGHARFGRLGGEEFGILLKADHETASHLAERIREAVRSRPVVNGTDENIDLTVSIGVAVTDAADPQADLMIRADTALYEAKSGGRDQVSVALDAFDTAEANARALAGAAAQLRNTTGRQAERTMRTSGIA